MKKNLFIALFLFFASFVTAQKTVVNDANAEARQLTGSFSSIKVSDGIDLFLTQSDVEAVAVSASKDKFRDNIKTEVRNNTLYISYESSSGVQVIIGSRYLRAYVSFKTLEKIHASGASDINVDGEISVPTLAMELSGASDFKGKVKLQNLSVDASGASKIKISGSADNVRIDLSGASDVKGYDLVTEVCNAKASGASDISISVNKEFTVHASGACDINYKGNAVLKDMKISGASNISKKG